MQKTPVQGMLCAGTSTTTVPRVTVIIIVFNGEGFLGEAIESVIAQTLVTWELLIVNDGSTDGSAAVAERYVVARPGHVRLLTHPGRVNRGMSASRNLALAHARGGFVAFLDADDVWIPEKLAEQVRILEREEEAAMVYGRTLIWHSWSGTGEEDFYFDLGVAPDQLHRPPRLFEILLDGRAQTPTTCNAMMRRELFAAAGGFEESFRGMFEDQVFFARALALAPAYVSGRSWAKYRQHSTSCSARSASKGQNEAARLRYLCWLIVHMSFDRRLGLRARAILLRALLRAGRDLTLVHLYRLLSGIRPAK